MDCADLRLQLDLHLAGLSGLGLGLDCWGLLPAALGRKVVVRAPHLVATIRTQQNVAMATQINYIAVHDIVLHIALTKSSQQTQHLDQSSA